MNCFICGNRATRRVTVEKMTGPSMRYLCCDNHEPHHIPQGDVVLIRVDTLPSGGNR
jgi:hypothetical protein